ncbi:SSU ribosomal protein S17P [Thermodesulfobium acidiphilum]|uniref:Small ribosomal subunit protein uS17 n=1 Tax=Thermodesulfobium acidiphilum TaxID=1794699 RepID=A0A2R4VZ97_THEAF|nr:30S ribosomal protein S17 [Thermodesulfobium acidiphilum]AWB09865.1 SSU ribosomal protein S17P [Thermodesulfobium acidiphilum]
MKKRLKGEVISDKMDKTVIVRVIENEKHPLYKKTIKVFAKFKAHDELNACKVGDTVVIEECRPISKEKNWRVVEIVSSKEESDDALRSIET